MSFIHEVEYKVDIIRVYSNNIACRCPQKHPDFTSPESRFEKGDWYTNIILRSLSYCEKVVGKSWDLLYSKADKISLKTSIDSNVFPRMSKNQGKTTLGKYIQMKNHLGENPEIYYGEDIDYLFVIKSGFDTTLKEVFFQCGIVDKEGLSNRDSWKITGDQSLFRPKKWIYLSEEYREKYEKDIAKWNQRYLHEKEKAFEYLYT